MSGSGSSVDYFDFKSKFAVFWPGLISTVSSDLLLYLLGRTSLAGIMVGSLGLAFSPVARSARISTRNWPVPRPSLAAIAYWPPLTVAQAAWRCPPAAGTKVTVASSSGEPSSVTLPLTLAPAPVPQPTSGDRQNKQTPIRSKITNRLAPVDRQQSPPCVHVDVVADETHRTIG